jgi:uncharacterized membrane protein
MLNALSDPFFIILCSGGLIFIGTGYFLKKQPPKEINHFYGYRTQKSMKNKEHWDFAQVYSAKAMMKMGGVLLILAFLGLFLTLDELTGTLISLGLLVGLVIIMILKIEKTLKQKFPE